MQQRCQVFTGKIHEDPIDLKNIGCPRIASDLPGTCYYLKVTGGTFKKAYRKLIKPNKRKK